MLRLTSAPTFSAEEKSARARMFHVAVWTTVPIVVGYMALVVINQPETMSRALPAAIVFLFFGISLLRLNRKRPRLAVILFVAGAVSLITAAAVTVGGGVRAPGVTLYLVIVLLTGLLLGQRASAITAAVCAVLCFGLVMAEKFDLLLPAIQYKSITLWYFSCLYMSLVVVLMRLPALAVRNATRHAQIELFERKRAEQELLEKQNLLQTMIEGAPTAIAMFDTQMRYIAYSKRWLIDYRLGNRDLVGLSHYEVFPEIDNDWRGVHTRCMGGATESREEDPFLRGDGTMDIVRWVVQPWQKGSGEAGGILMLTDVITDRVRAREERRSLRDQLQQAQKMDALGTLAGGIAHDFNNLLAIISTNSESGCVETASGGPARSYFDEIKKASARANELVGQILLFSRKQDSVRKSISLLPVVVDAVALLRATLPSNVEFQTTLSAVAPAVVANATQIYQILINLGTNAGQAMPTGGVLTVSLDLVQITKSEAAACGELHEGDYVRIAVQDNGIGMTRSTIDRVFEPFFTTRGLDGTGLGLSVVHGLVKDHGGAITIESELDKGSTFRVYFPVARAVAVDPLPPVGDGAVRGKSQHILYIDDEESLAHAMKRLLIVLGYRCTTYSDPEMAVNSFRANPDQFDAVIVDMTMPRLSGLDVAKELRAIRSSTPIALTSGNPGRETLNVSSSFVDTWLSKPASIDNLCHTLDVLLQKRREDILQN